MPNSPLVANMDFVSIDIFINGSKIKDAYDVFSIEVDRQVSHTASAKFSISLPDGGGGENAPFSISESKDFLPGNTVEIKAGYNTSSKTIFKGIIIGHAIRTRPEENAELRLRCQAAAAKLTVGSKTTAFEKMTDSAVISKVLSNAKLENTVAETTYEHPQLIQHRMTDWDFIISRAAANGMIVYSEFDKVFIAKPETSKVPDLEVNYERDVFEFDGEMDAGHQFPDATAEGWDFTSGKMVKGDAKEPRLNQQGNIKGTQLAQVLDLADERLVTTLPLSKDSLKAVANAKLLQSRLAALRGRVVFYGSAVPKLNTLIELRGFGARFNGNALITRIRHSIAEGRWTTEIGFGLPPDWSASPIGHTSHHPNEASQVRGLQNGVVTNIHADPEKQARIKVSIPALGTEVWARQSSLYATKGAGAFFLPEVGDEVLLGFLADDPRFAVILGSLPGPGHESGYKADKQNSIKALTTKNHLKLELNDTDKVITIATPGGNTIVLSDKGKSIVLTDENKNEVTLDKGGITLKSARDIVLDASGKVSIKAKQTIEAISSGGDVLLKGNNVAGDGKIGVAMKGGATAELSASGQTTVKGGMVMIN